MSNKTIYPFQLASTLALRQLRGHKSFAISMVINMALGLTGFIVVDGFNRSFRSEISSRTRQIASADIVISSRQPWSPPLEQKIKSSIPPEATISQEASLVSMATTKDLSRLIEARFVDNQFPLYPGLQLETIGQLQPGPTSRLNLGEAWIYRELRTQMGLKIGDKLQIGETEFIVSDTVIDDPTAGAGGFSFAPRVFLRIEDLPKTKLLGVGSRSFHIFRVKLPQDLVAGDEDALAESIRSSIAPDAGLQDLRVKSHRKTTDDLTKLQGYVNGYLSLIALSALFLAAGGTSYLMRGHLQKTIKEFAIMSSLGAKPWIAPLVFVIQCIVLGLGATLLATAFASLGLPALARTLSPIAGSITTATLPVGSILVTSLFAIVSGLLLTLPQLIQLSTLRPGFLFQEANSAHESRRTVSSLAFLPAVVLWWLTAVQQSKSWETGSIFAAICIGSAIVLTFAALPMLKLGIVFAKKQSMNWKLSLALRQMSRNRRATISTFLALALGTTLINLIPQLRSMILREIARPDSVIPQLFMFDMQDEQIESVQAYFNSFGGKLGQLSPMVRARLESINDTPVEDRKMDFEGEREQQQREALQARTQNLSYRTKLSPAETIIK
jgi:putative ABC transport system permease protein